MAARTDGPWTQLLVLATRSVARERWRTNLPTARSWSDVMAVAEASVTLLHAPPLMLRWSHSREIPLGSVAVQRTRTGTVDPRILPEIRPVVGAITVGAIPSAITRFTFVVRVMPEDVPVIVNGYVPTGVAAGSEAVVP